MNKSLLLALVAFGSLGMANAKRVTNQELVDYLAKQELDFVDFSFTDLNGSLRSVTIPINQAARAMKEGLFFDGSSIPGFTQIYESDLQLKPDVNTFTAIPWGLYNQKSARVLCDVYRNDRQAYPHDPRTILKNILEQAAQMGYKFYVGPELEFFLFKRAPDGELAPIDTRKYFDTELNVQAEGQKKVLLSALIGLDIPIEKMHHEVAPGQHEVSIRYDDALTIADQLMMVKTGIRSLAQSAGMLATFMPKPLSGQNGSGMHIHFSLWDINNSTNAFYEENSTHQLSATARHFIAGVLKYTPDFSAIFNASINSYKRLIPGFEAPVYLVWGRKNRSALVRIPELHDDQPNSVRAEIRCPDATCNPYLAFAALLACGLEGIKNKEELPDAYEVNLYHLTQQEIANKHILTLPNSLENALVLLDNSELARRTFGDELIDQYVELKRNECQEYNRTVFTWELDRYL